MKIYHGNIEQVERPELRQSNRTLDYGSGFYTTTSFKQAEDWVRRRMKENEATHGYVNTYELEESVMQALNCLIFPIMQPGLLISHRYVCCILRLYMIFLAKTGL